VDLQETELGIWRDAALLETDVSELNQWLDSHGDDLETEERDALERLISAVESARRRHATATANPQHGGETTTDALDPIARLNELQQRREELLERVRSPRKRTSAREARESTAKKP
jgi:hypothetical protein